MLHLWLVGMKADDTGNSKTWDREVSEMAVQCSRLDYLSVGEKANWGKYVSYVPLKNPQGQVWAASDSLRREWITRVSLAPGNGFTTGTSSYRWALCPCNIICLTDIKDFLESNV